MADPSELVVPLSSLGMAAAAVYRAGGLSSTVKNHGDRLDSVEEELKRSVTRGELDARFEALDNKIDLVLEILKTQPPRS